jgi:hypothetical protein
MIEPHSAQLGASSWILKATFALPSDSVTVDPFPFVAFPVAAWPLAATTANSSRAGEEVPLEAEPAAATMEVVSDAPTPGVPAAETAEPAEPEGASSFKAVAVGASGAEDVPPAAVDRST